MARISCQCPIALFARDGTYEVLCACVLFCFVLNLVFLSRYMRPEGPWQWRAFLYNLFLPRTNSRCHSGVSPPSTLRPPKKENKIRQRKETKARHILGRTWSVLLVVGVRLLLRGHWLYFLQIRLLTLKTKQSQTRHLPYPGVSQKIQNRRCGARVSEKETDRGARGPQSLSMPCQSRRISGVQRLHLTKRW